jgi:hypothetical protein
MYTSVYPVLQEVENWDRQRNSATKRRSATPSSFSNAFLVSFQLFNADAQVPQRFGIEHPAQL